MRYIIPFVMIGTGVTVGICMGLGKVDISALLLIAPMVMFGVWILAVIYVKRKFTTYDNR